MEADSNEQQLLLILGAPLCVGAVLFLLLNLCNRRGSPANAQQSDVAPETVGGEAERAVATGCCGGGLAGCRAGCMPLVSLATGAATATDTLVRPDWPLWRASGSTEGSAADVLLNNGSLASFDASGSLASVDAGQELLTFTWVIGWWDPGRVACFTRAGPGGSLDDLLGCGEGSMIDNVLDHFVVPAGLSLVAVLVSWPPRLPAPWKKTGCCLSFLLVWVWAAGLASMLVAWHETIVVRAYDHNIM